LAGLIFPFCTVLHFSPWPGCIGGAPWLGDAVGPRGQRRRREVLRPRSRTGAAPPGAVRHGARVRDLFACSRLHYKSALQKSRKGRFSV